MAGTTIGAVLRSTHAHCLQLSQTEALEWGVAYTSTRFAGLPDANQLREFMVPDENDVPTACAAVDACFARRGLTCLRWAPAMEQPHKAVGRFLSQKGYQRRDRFACALAEWPDVTTRDDVRILPARAMRREYRRTFTAPTGPHRDLRAEAGLERLDDAGYEASLAVLDGRPVGRCALLQTGDIGRVIDLYVLPEHRRRGVGTALLAHVLGVARRFMARMVCLAVGVDNSPALRCVERMGFVRDGTLVEFHHPDAVLPNDDDA